MRSRLRSCVAGCIAFMFVAAAPAAAKSAQAIERHLQESSSDAMAQRAADTVASWIALSRRKILEEYLQLLAIPNVATDLVNIRRNASALLQMMESRGLKPRLLEHGSPDAPPAVYGEWRVPGAQKTIVLYAHYDGQPVQERDWTVTQPFAPVIATGPPGDRAAVRALPADEQIDPDWRIYARSASDDKLGVIAILSAIDALRAVGKQPAYNLKIFFEGEEEAGSPHLAELLDRHRNALASDGWIIIDGPGHPSGKPQIVLGVRGDVNLHLTTYGPIRPLHSGHYGNWAPNPAMMLSQLIASMKNKSGRVTIAGFYDDVEPLSSADRAALEAVPAADDQLKRELGLGWTEGAGRPLLELLMEPSLNVNGIRAAEAGPGARNVIPTSATATLDLRLVKGVDVQRQVERVISHIEQQGYRVLDRQPTIEERINAHKIVTIIRGPGYNAERTSITHPLAQQVINGMAPVEPVVLPSLGGSLPLYIFKSVLGAPTVTLSLANHDNNQHAEDENVRLGNVWTAIESVAAVISR
jgi:acetylornithine deacetylase/succinyl-diaminopimelate desuccinylase-like protein